MADNNAKIGIAITSEFDAKGTNQAQQALGSLQQKTSTAAASTKELGTSQQAVAQHIQDSMNPAVAAAAQQLDQVSTRASRSTLQLGQLKSMVKGLAFEFPLLGQAARLVMNPLTGAVAGIAAGFSLWRHRVDELTRALGAVPREVGILPIRRVQDQTNAYNSLADAVERVFRAFNSAEGVADRAIARIEQQAQLQQQLLQSQRQMELAGARTPAERAEIEGRYNAAGIRVTREEEQRIQAQRRVVEGNVVARGQQRIREAGRVPSEAAESILDENMTQRELTARRQLEHYREQMALVAEFRGGSRTARRVAGAQLGLHHGALVTADDIERTLAGERLQALSELQEVRRFRSQQRDWARRRQLRQSGLEDIASGAQMFADNTVNEQSARQRWGVQDQVAVNNQAAVLIEALRNAQEENARLGEAANRMVQSTGELNATLTDSFRRTIMDIQSINEQLRQLRQRP